MKRLRYVATVNPPVQGLTRQHRGIEISFLPLDQIWSDDRFDPRTVIEFSGDIASYNPVAEGDILVPKVSPTFAQGRVAIARGLANGMALATSEVFVVRPHVATDASFLRYRLLASDFRQQGEASWTGVAGLKRISAGFLRDVPLARRAWADRSAIAQFLDRESVRISALIDRLEAAKRLAAEWMNARIRELIGAGVDSVAFGRYATLQRGFDLPSHSRGEGRIPVIGSGGVTGRHDVPAAPAPAVVTGRYGSIGTVTWVDEPCWPLNTTLYVRDFKGNEPRFVYWALQGLPLEQEAAKSAVPGLHRSDVHRLRLGRFDLPAQRAIADELDQRGEKTIRLQRELDSQLRLVTAYRDSLITEAVTGALGAGDRLDVQMAERLTDGLTMETAS